MRVLRANKRHQMTICKFVNAPGFIPIATYVATYHIYWITDPVV